MYQTEDIVSSPQPKGKMAYTSYSLFIKQKHRNWGKSHTDKTVSGFGETGGGDRKDPCFL